MSLSTSVPEVIEIKLPSRLEILSVLDTVTLSVCQRMEFDEATTSQVSMSVIEAGTNAIQHGHKRDPSRPFDARFLLFPDRVEVEVTDHGSGFELAAVNGDVTSADHLFDARGRGIFIMRACMDTVDFAFGPTGTVCRLVKRRPEPSAATGS